MSRRPQNTKEILMGIKRIWLPFYPQIHKQRWLLTAAGLGLVTEVFARLLVPIPLKLIFDYIIVPGDRSLPFTIPLIPETNTLVLLTIFTIGIVAATGLRATVAYISLLNY